MFILRRIDKTGEHNYNLGEYYTYTHKEVNPEEFKELSKMRKSHSSEIYGYVVSERHRIVVELYKGDEAFIMTPNGKTFANLSY